MCRRMERCQALAAALNEKPLQSVILSGNDCCAEGGKAAGLQNGLKSRFQAVAGKGGELRVQAIP